MKGLITVLLLGCAIGATACGDEKKPAAGKPAATATGAAKAAPKPAPANTAGGGW